MHYVHENSPDVAVTLDELENKATGKENDGQARVYTDVLEKAGGLASFPSVSISPATTVIKFHRQDGLFITGGKDISPDFYGAEADATTDPMTRRNDEMVLALTKMAIANKMPILGSCRGAQMLNVAYGGTLYQDLRGERWQTVNHINATKDPAYRHKVKVNTESRLGRLMVSAMGESDEYDVNSWHHQGPNKLGKGLKATAWAEDGLVEAVEAEDPDHFVLGTQWHLEAMEEFAPVFERFIEACTEYRYRRLAGVASQNALRVEVLEPAA